MASDTLHLSIGTEHLNAAIYILRPRQPETRYPDAWRVLTTEAGRRRDGGSAGQVHMTRAAFEALPTVVQDLLISEQPHG